MTQKKSSPKMKETPRSQTESTKAEETDESVASAQTALLSVRNLRKTYGGRVEAVRGLSFDVKPGICFGLLGPNGAGKTTTIEILEGILERSSGEIYFRGAELSREVDSEYRQRIGIQFQDTALPDFLNTQEVLRLFSSFYSRPVLFEQIVEDCQLQDLLTREPRKLSGGQRQRVLLALALVNDPDLIFLDEPTTGLDPQARRQFWELVQRIKAQGKTLILTTHYMDEAEILCDEIAIVDRGQLIEIGSPRELLQKHFAGAVIETDENREALQVLKDAGLKLEGLRIKTPTLEDLFLKLTGRRLLGEHNV